jgi:AraC-like DNA-binding protein
MATNQVLDLARRFCSDDLPEQDRMSIWPELVGRTIARLDGEPLCRAAFRFEFISRALPALNIISGFISGPTVRTQRRRELIADGNDEIQLMLMDEGCYFASQFGREVVVDAGTAVLVSNADVNSIATPGVKGRMLRIPRKTMLPFATRLEDAFMRPIPRTGEALRLLAAYLDVLEKTTQPATPEFRHLIVTHVHDLVALAIGVTRDAAEIASGRGLRAARFAAITTDIAKNIDRHDLSAEWVAPRHRVSPSTVRRLFEEHGTTFSQFVLDYRLAQAHRCLRDPRRLERSISSIAFSLGFYDLSYFNRTFRRFYGATPSDVREEMFSGGGGPKRFQTGQD